MSKNFRFAILFPLLAVALIALYAGGLGVTFMLVNESALDEGGVIVLGTALVVLVPLIAYLLERRTEQG